MCVNISASAAIKNMYDLNDDNGTIKHCNYFDSEMASEHSHPSKHNMFDKKCFRLIFDDMILRDLKPD